MHCTLTVIHLPNWFPGAGLKQVALKWRRVVDSALQAPYDKVKGELVSFSRCPAAYQTRDIVCYT